ncbi:MAG TPA: hypothetical protein VMG59_11950 [Phycisphaerae bacterium]|nr:hypothetical protein [Phycisphaerae bacterium]
MVICFEGLGVKKLILTLFVWILMGLFCSSLYAQVNAAGGANSSTPAAPTLAVLPFVPSDPNDASMEDLAERMRFAVDQKISRDGHFNRTDDHDVDAMISALQLTWTAPVSDSDIHQVISALGTDQTIAGFVDGRQLTLRLYVGEKLTKTVVAVIPPDNTSPRLTIEGMLTRLEGIQFTHVTEQQVNHSNPVIEALFAARPNLAPDPEFSAALAGNGVAAEWEVFLQKQDYHPRFVSASDAADLPRDTAAIVPQNAATPASAGYCLMMRIGKFVADNNGLACESMWIPVIDGHHYRFAAEYHSNGPDIQIFLKGFAYWPDEFSTPDNLASQRKEIYRAQLLTLTKNDGWDTTEMDFTPTSLARLDKAHPIQWLRIDFFVYLYTGDVFFRNVVLKDITPDSPTK